MEAPAVRDYALCGYGDRYQANVQTTHNPSFRLFSQPEPGHKHYDEALAELADDLSEEFEQRARDLILRKRAETGLDDLEITVFIAREGLQVLYAKAHPQKLYADPAPVRPVWPPEGSGSSVPGGSGGTTSPGTGTIVATSIWTRFWWWIKRLLGRPPAPR